MSQIAMLPHVREHLCSDSVQDSDIDIKGVTYTIHELLGAPGQTGVTRRCTDEYGDSYAVKFTTYRTYQHGRSYLEEVLKSRKLRNCANIARLEAVAEVRLELPDRQRNENLVCLVMEYIDGACLADYLKNTSVDPSFLKAFVISMCEAMHDFQFNGLYHNDLHDRNIMICDPYPGALEREGRIVKVIDLGEVATESAPVDDNMDDHTQLVNHLVSIYNRILDNLHSLPIDDRAYLKAVKPILATMTEEDTQRRLRSARSIREEFERAWWESHRIPAYIGSSSPVLQTPFDYIQAEHIVSDKTLEALFSDKCPWYDRVKGPDPVNIDGPRGCGKSTVFLMLRLKTLLHTKTPEELLSAEEVGFYIPCSSELGGRFANLSEQKANDFADEILHFFNLTLLNEIVGTPREVSLRSDREEIFGWTDQADREFHRFILDILAMSDKKKDRLEGISRLDHLMRILDQERMLTHQCILRNTKLGSRSSPSLLSDVTSHLVSNVLYFRRRRILLLLDDYSLHRVPIHVQRILNQVVWLQVNTYVCKVSSEIGGVVATEPIGGGADTSREFVEVNVGTEYLDLSHHQKATYEFIEDILDRRLDLAGYSGTAKQLLGDTSYPEDITLGAALKAEKRGGHSVYYHGIQCMADLCSGDIAATLGIIRHIFQRVGLTESSTTQISPREQHRAVQDFSRDFYAKIRDFTPFGKEMQQLVHAFGWTSRTLLRKHPGVRSRGTDRLDPYEMIRIEWDDDPTAPELPEKERQIVRELLRRAVFIELPKGRSRRSVLARRLQLRRVYCPVFGMSLSHSEPMGIDHETFRYLLYSPRDVCEGQLKRRLTATKVDIPRNLEQLPMHDILEDAGS